jgi:hypothetical protein
LGLGDAKKGILTHFIDAFCLSLQMFWPFCTFLGINQLTCILSNLWPYIVFQWYLEHDFHCKLEEI